jgi:hypothetical protein
MKNVSFSKPHRLPMKLEILLSTDYADYADKRGYEIEK